MTIKGARDELLQVIRAMAEDKKSEDDPLVVSAFDKYTDRLKKVAGMLLNLMPEDLQPCPKCDGPMCIRRARTNGSQFLGCTEYPRCRGTRPWPPIPSVVPQTEDPSSMRDIYKQKMSELSEIAEATAPGMARVVNLNDAKRKEQEERREQERLQQLREAREAAQRMKRRLAQQKAEQQARARAAEQARLQPSRTPREYQKQKTQAANDYQKLKPKPKPKSTSFDRKLDIDFDE